jgi:hypothetical protein
MGDRKATAATEAGHCYDTSSQYKITGKHRESGELTWRHDLRAPIPLNTMVLTCIDHWDIQWPNDPSKRHSMIFLTLLMAADSLMSRNLRRGSTVFCWHGHRISAAAMSHFGLAWHSFGPYPEVLTPYVGNYSPYILWTIVIVTMLLLFRIFDPVNLLFGA